MREDLTQRRFIEETYRIISTEGREALRGICAATAPTSTDTSRILTSW